MKFMRMVSLIALALMLSVGFASVTEAAVLDSVKVVSPDSGVIRGIDSTLTAQLYFRSTHADSGLMSAYVWLATAASDTVEIADGSREAWADSISAAQGDTTAAGAPNNAANSYVSARIPLKTSTFLTAGVMDTSTTKLGDIDTALVTTGPAGSGLSWLVQVKLVIGADVGEIDNVNVYGAVYDDVNKDPAVAKDGYTDVKRATNPGRTTTWATKLDGDRPSQSTLQVPVVTALGASSITGLTKLPGTQPILGIGDSIQVGYDLGSSGDDIILTGDVTLSATLDLQGKSLAINLGNITQKVGNAYLVIAEDQFGNVSATGDTSGVVSLFLTDGAGNLSSPGVDDAAPEGLTASADFVVDAKKPVIDGGIAGNDTLLPVDDGKMTDGGIRAAYLDDLNPLTYELGEALRSLKFTFDSETDANDRTFTITAADTGTATDPFVFNDVALAAVARRTIDLTAAADDSTMPMIYNGTTAVSTLGKMAGLVTGTYTVKAQGTDLAGNAGPELARTMVYVDVDDVSLGDRFPTKLAFGPTTEARLDTIEESTSIVTFKLSEPTDSVIVVYTKIVGADTKAERTRRLNGSELTNTTLVQSITVDSLVHNTQYALTILARDLAGNYTKVGPDSFLYDTSFVVPLIKRFVVDSSVKGLGSPATAGAEITVTVVADATLDGTRDAVTYKEEAILKVERQNGGDTGVTLTGDGVTDLGGGRATLSADDWLAGKRTVTLKNTTAIDTLTLTVVDSSDVDMPYVGTADSVVVYNPAAYTKIVVSVPAEVAQGEEFMVDLTLADEFGNRRVADDRYVALAANKIGVVLPEGEVYVEDGMATVMAVAEGFSGSGLVIRATDLVDVNTGAAIRHGASSAIAVAAGGQMVDAPDTLIAEDYKGALGGGDQGGFVALTWALSADHAELDGYRIYREMMVNYRAGGEGEDAIVMLDDAVMDWVPWGIVDAVPGETLGRAVVATLDGNSTRWAVAAEMEGSTSASKEAFDGAGIGTAYELMASTMVESKQAAEQLVEGPVFATLTPEALSFIESGVVPQMKSVTTMIRSNLTPTAVAVRAIDNIAPEAVAVMGAKDTPNDAGGSITVSWTMSASDALVTRSVPNAVGSSLLSDQVPGVNGYNIYRQANGGEFALVGKASAGATRYADDSAFNGVRYTYLVRPFDADNEAEISNTRTAMAIRNNVVDASGVRINGLFGMDNTVGFDDFFLFADNFGMTAADEGFEPAFDLVPNAKVDFEDFFLFADSFGSMANIVGKVIPMMAGLNTDARLYLDAGSELPAIGDEIAIAVDLADFAEMKGYGLNVSFDAEVLEFVGIVSENSLLGEGDFAAAQVISEADGEVAVAAYGETVTEGALDLSLVFRTKTEIENTYVEVTESEVRDGNYAVNQVALPAPVQIQTRPEVYALANNYPNPFNPATTIKYALPEAGYVQLEIYNVMGQVVRTLAAEQQNAGRYVVQWDATNDNGNALSSGIYFYRLQAGGEFLQVKKMLLLK